MDEDAIKVEINSAIQWLREAYTLVGIEEDYIAALVSARRRIDKLIDDHLEAEDI